MIKTLIAKLYAFTHPPAPTPTEKKTMTTYGQRRITHQQLKTIFVQIKSNPLIGKGHISEEDHLIDAILAHINTAIPELSPQAAEAVAAQANVAPGA